MTHVRQQEGRPGPVEVTIGPDAVSVLRQAVRGDGRGDVRGDVRRDVRGDVRSDLESRPADAVDFSTYRQVGITGTLAELLPGHPQ